MLNHTRAMKPFWVQKSGVELPIRLEGHRAFAWKDTIIVWGGRDKYDPTSRRNFGNDASFSVVYSHQSGIWKKIETNGDPPSDAYEVSAQVINDTMYVLGASPGPMHCLDLNSWTWKRLTPGGNPPTDYTWNVASWAYKDKIFCFGGTYSSDDDDEDEEPSNQLFCYNTTRNTWEWPEQKGDIPSPRLGHTVTVSGDTVFMFGGCGGCAEQMETYEDLHILDMLTMRWKKVHGNLPGLKIFSWSSTLTRVSESKAVLYGNMHPRRKFEKAPMSMVLDLDKAKHTQDDSSIWKPVLNPHPRSRHAAVMEPVSQNLWIIGGRVGNDITSEILEVPMRMSLKHLAIDCAARGISSDDHRLKPGQYPKRLRDEVEAQRRRVKEERFLVKKLRKRQEVCGRRGRGRHL